MSGNSRRWMWVGLLGLLLGAVAGWVFATRPVPMPPPAPELTAAERAAIGEFVQRYFGSWSTRDIDGYGRCFHPNARVWFGSGSSLALAPFLDSQRQAHATSPVPLNEVPLSWEATAKNGLAHVQVHWELHRGRESVRGYDFFTLVFAERRWQIIALVFNEE